MSIDCSPAEWEHVPEAFRYLQRWAHLGVRGLTVHFGTQPPLKKLASQSELADLRIAYETIAERDDAAAISEWCLSIPAETAANEVKEHIRGLLLLFECLADYDLAPFTDERVRFLSAEEQPFAWSVLPAHLQHWEPWLKKFEHLRSEAELYDYVKFANVDQRRELKELKRFLANGSDDLQAWFVAANVAGHPARREAFQAEWLFVLVDLLGR
jgi:hypothetical protein